MLRRAGSIGLTAVLLLGFAPAPVQVPVPVFGDNVELVATIPDVTAISTAFSSDTPHMYVNTLNGISVYDISDPELPTLTGFYPLPHFENEGMDVGERADGTKFVIIGLDQYGVSATSETLARTSRAIYIIDVTDPSAPFLRSELKTETSTHTVQCADAVCDIIYTSGIYEDTFEVIDVSDLDAPAIVAKRASTIGGSHQWTEDDAGIIWGASWDGAAGMDVTDQRNPVTLNTTDANGRKGAPGGYNDFVLHNVDRPNATAFIQTPVLDADGLDTGRVQSGTKATASVEDGNVLLVTEEDYDNPVCGGDAGEGAFSTWYIPSLDADQAAVDNPLGKPYGGTITPLDKWNTEILNSGQPTVAGALCSAHYFTYNDAGFVAQGWYQQGTRILDVRDPSDIKQVGYWFTGDTETWHAYWVPERDEEGVVTGKDTNLVYTNDVARGIDVLRVTLPDSAPERTEPVTAPILPVWLTAGAALPASAPSETFGYACRLAGL